MMLAELRKPRACALQLKLRGEFSRQIKVAIRWQAEHNMKREAAAQGLQDMLVFTDLLHMDERVRGKALADLFLDTPEYNAHGTATEVLSAGEGTPSVANKKLRCRYIQQDSVCSHHHVLWVCVQVCLCSRCLGTNLTHRAWRRVLSCRSACMSSWRVRCRTMKTWRHGSSATPRYTRL